MNVAKLDERIQHTTKPAASDSDLRGADDGGEPERDDEAASGTSTSYQWRW